MNVQIENAIKRVRGYWFIDGFTEMSAGGLFTLLAGILLLRENASQTSFAWLISVVSQVTVAKFVGLLVAILILWWLKDHFTYPRTGFAKGSKITMAQVLAMIKNIFLFLLLPLFGLLAVSLFMASTSSVLSSMPVWFPVALGILWSVLFVLAGEWMGLRRFRLMGIVILLAGTVIGIRQFVAGRPAVPANAQPEISLVVESLNQTLISLSLLILVSGILLIVSGILTFMRYRRENPSPYTEDV